MTRIWSTGAQHLFVIVFMYGNTFHLNIHLGKLFIVHFIQGGYCTCI